MCLGLTSKTPAAVATPTATVSFKKGDKVRILRKAKRNENGWKNEWVEEMDLAIGKIGIVQGFRPNDKDVTLAVPGIATLGYPSFALELVNETPAATPVFKKGDKVRVDYTPHSAWSGEGVVQGDVTSKTASVSVKFARTGFYDLGGFRQEYVSLLPISVPSQPISVSASTQPISRQSQALRSARDLAVKLGKENPGRRVTIDWVQDELSKLGFSSTDLGNAAGVIFNNEQFRNTGTTAKSIRKGNNHRRITVWEYVGGETNPVVTPKTSTGFIVEAEFSNGWQRSRNSTVDGERLDSRVFNTFEEAEKEATRQQLGNTFNRAYRAVPLS